MQESDSQGKKSDRVEEFLELFSQHQQKLYVYIVSLVFNPTDAYDVLQDTNLALWQKFDDYTSGTNFYAWASEIAKYRALRFRQKRANRFHLHDETLVESLATKVADRSEEQQKNRLDALKNCLEKLPEKDQVIIRGRYEPDCTLRKLSHRLGRSENALSQALRRIRRQLAECIQRRLRLST